MKNNIHNHINMIIGIKIRQARNKRGITQINLGKRLGVSGQQIHKYEIAHDNISAINLWKIAKITNISIKNFYQVDNNILAILDFKNISQIAN